MKPSTAIRDNLRRSRERWASRMTDDKKDLLRQIVQLRQQILDRARRLSGQGSNSAEDVERAEIELIEAKLRLLE